MSSTDGLWSIVLAGGEGERTRAFVESRLGYHRPKQYCVFTGTRSLFQHTVDRADALSNPERRVVVAAQSHRDVVFEQLRGRGEGTLLFQPENRGTGAGVFLALTSIVARDPTATVVIYPSDHFIYPESALLNFVRTAVRHTERCADEPVLLGVRPSSPELDYGWIVPSSRLEDRTVQRVESFLEKPPRRLAEKALEKGGLWNTMILAGKVDSFLALGWRCIPEIMRSFARFGKSLRTGRADGALEEIYQNLPSRDLSSHVLQRAPDRLRVLDMSGIWWDDWGRPERILSTLRALERSDEFPKALVLEPEETLVHAASPRRQEVSHVP